MSTHSDELAAALGIAPVNIKPVTRPGWIVMQYASEYNDEYNTTTDGGDPASVVFLDHEAAQVERDRLQKEWQETTDPDDWYDAPEDIDMFYVQKVQVVV